MGNWPRFWNSALWPAAIHLAVLPPSSTCCSRTLLASAFLPCSAARPGRLLRAERRRRGHHRSAGRLGRGDRRQSGKRLSPRGGGRRRWQLQLWHVAARPLCRKRLGEGHGDTKPPASNSTLAESSRCNCGSRRRDGRKPSPSAISRRRWRRKAAACRTWFRRRR